MPRSFLVKKVADCEDGTLHASQTDGLSDVVMDESYDSGCEHSDTGEEIGKLGIHSDFWI